MQKQTDLRIIRTRQMIKEAFLELLESIEFSKITIENLTKKAFINRNTFYLHYTDKFDLINQLENEVLDGLKDILKTIPVEVLKVKGLNDDRLISIIHQIYQYIKENDRFFILMMSDNGDPAFLLKFGDTIKSVILSKTLEGQMKIPQRYLFAIIPNIITGIIREWLNSGLKESPDELADMIVMILGDVPKRLYVE
jgi:hypothetical protein